MARKYPKFLWSNPTNTKSAGPFIIHAQPPRFIVKPMFDDKRNLIDTSLVDIWEQDYDSFEVDDVVQKIPMWFTNSGRSQSIHKDDKLICAINQLEFLKDYKCHFTIDEARKTLQVLFPSKAMTIYNGSSSYGLKHLLESVSGLVVGEKYGAHKYCSNETIIKAFELEGFRWTQDGPNRFMNLKSSEVKQAYLLFR